MSVGRYCRLHWRPERWVGFQRRPDDCWPPLPPPLAARAEGWPPVTSRAVGWSPIAVFIGGQTSGGLLSLRRRKDVRWTPLSSAAERRQVDASLFGGSGKTSGWTPLSFSGSGQASGWTPLSFSGSGQASGWTPVFLSGGGGKASGGRLSLRQRPSVRLDACLSLRRRPGVRVTSVSFSGGGQASGWTPLSQAAAKRQVGRLSLRKRPSVRLDASLSPAAERRQSDACLFLWRR